MSTTLVKNSEPNFAALEAVILQGDIGKMNETQRSQYVVKLCEVMGLNPMTKPFEVMTLQGKMVCYAGKNCAEQLRKVHNVSLRVTAREKIEDVYVVTVEASMPNGRVDSSTGAVPLSGLKGDALANAMMKAETKAKRRATLSICSLGMLDETEVETIKPQGGQVQQPGPEDGDTSDKPGYIYYGYYTRKHPTQVERDEGRGALIDERDRLAGISKEDAQRAYHVIDEYLKLSEPLADCENDLPPYAPKSTAEPAQRAHPVCGCGGVYVKSRNKPVYYCPNFKEPGVHGKSVPANEVEG